MNLGEYLRGLIYERGTNISLLARRAGIRSKNEIYRLFNDQYSCDKTQALIDKLVPFLELTESEIRRLYELIKRRRGGGIEKKEYEMLAELFKDVRHDVTDAAARLGNMLSRRGKISVFIGPETGMDIADAVETALKSSGGNIEVIHIVSFGRSETVVAGELYVLIRLLPYSGYSCHEKAKIGFKGLICLYESGEDRVVFTADEKGRFAESAVSDEFYEFMLDKFSGYKNGKDDRNDIGKITSHADTFTRFSLMETYDNLIFDGGFGFAFIPFGTLYKMFEDANYFGLPYDSDYVSEIIEAAHERYLKRLASDNRHQYVLSEERVREFLKTGRTFDHARGFRAMTKSEIRDMLDKFFGDMDISFRFFAPGFRRAKVETGIIYGKCLFLWNSEAGYDSGQWFYKISHPNILRLFEGFARYFWEKCTLSDRESAEMMYRLFEDLAGE